MSEKREIAAFALAELKLAGAARTFTGYGAVFGNVDGHGDVIAKGAFRRSLSEHKAAGSMPAMLSQHGSFLGGDAQMPIGVWTAMEEDGFGLKVEGRLSDTPRGNEAYTLLKDGALTGLSIGYMTRKATIGTKPGEPKRTLTDVELLEVSLVTFPSNGKARVVGVKDVLTVTERDCERALRDAGVPRELAKAILAKGWRAATDRRDAGGELEQVAVAAIKASTESLFKLFERTK